MSTAQVLDSASLAVLENGGKCGQLIAPRDWAESLGPPAAWPQSLKTAIALMLRGLAIELGGTALIAFARDGVVCTFDAPLPEGGV